MVVFLKNSLRFYVYRKILAYAYMHIHAHIYSSSVCVIYLHIAPTVCVSYHTSPKTWVVIIIKNYYILKNMFS